MEVGCLASRVVAYSKDSEVVAISSSLRYSPIC